MKGTLFLHVLLPWVVLSLHPLRCILEVLVKGIMVLHVLMPQMVLSLHPLRRILDFIVKNGIPLRFGMPQMVLSLHLFRHLLGALYSLKSQNFKIEFLNSILKFWSNSGRINHIRPF